MTDRKPILLDAWHLDAAGPADDPVLRGLVGGAPHVSAPIEALSPEDGRARSNEGTEYTLGEANHAIGRDPAAMPPETMDRRRRRAREALARIRSGNLPTAEELAEAPLLQAWRLVPNGPWLALSGVVEGHPRLHDGSWITTSTALWVSPDRRSARTVSRWYRLGTRFDEALLLVPEGSREG